MNKHIIFYISFVLIFWIIILLLPQQLVLDGENHYFYAQYEKCESLYGANVGCWLSKPFSGDKTTFWSFYYFFLSSIPLIFYYFYRNVKVLSGFFLFTGTFFTIELMQIYAQLMIIPVILYFLLSRDFKIKIYLGILLINLALLGTKIHRLQFEITIFLIMLEIIIYLVIRYHKEIRKFVDKNMIVIPFYVEGSAIINNIRAEILEKNSHNIFYMIIYYGYHLFIEGMPFFFMIPAIKSLFCKENFRYLVYFSGFSVLAIGFLIYYNFSPWIFTRIWLLVPLTLLIPFIVWLEKKDDRTQKIFWTLGIIWLIIQCLWFFFRRFNMIF